MGLFVNIEGITKPMLARHYDDNGNLYEGVVSDFREKFIGSFEQKTNKNSDPSRSDLAAVMSALDSPVETLNDALEALIDYDQFFRFWAFEILVNHRDGHAGNTNNFYLYRNPADEKFNAILWGTDAAFQDLVRADAVPGLLAYSHLHRRLLEVPENKVRLENELRNLLDTVWNEEHILTRMDEISLIVEQYASDEDRALHPIQKEAMQTFISERRSELLSIYDEAFPEWPEDTIRGPICRKEVGTFTATFDAIWGTITDGVFTHGTESEFSFDIDGFQNAAWTRVGTRAGVHANGYEYIQFFGDDENRNRFVVSGRMPNDYYTPGTHELRSGEAFFGANWRNLDNLDVINRFTIGIGSITFDEAGTEDGDVLRGTMTAPIWVITP